MQRNWVTAEEEGAEQRSAGSHRAASPEWSAGGSGSILKKTCMQQLPSFLLDATHCCTMVQAQCKRLVMSHIWKKDGFLKGAIIAKAVIFLLQSSITTGYNFILLLWKNLYKIIFFF